MKKETVYAILLGVTFGVVLSLVMIFKTKDSQMGKSKPLTSEKKVVPTIQDSNLTAQTFKINEPQDRQIFNTKSISIKGVAEKDSVLIVQSPIKDIVFKVEKEEFSVDMPLALGENVISLTLYPKNSQGRSQQKELRIYYLDEQ